MRPRVLVVLAATLVSCSSEPPAVAMISPSPAQSQAADLRTQIDLLLAEHVMIVAKVSAAALNRTDDYAGYAMLLNTNASDISRVLSRAVGNTTASQLTKTWSEQNGYLVGYAIALASHDDDKAKAAAQPLSGDLVTRFAQQLSEAAGIPIQEMGKLLRNQLAADKAFVDGISAQKYPAFYTDLHAAYAKATELGDAVALGIVRRFPDKFPGNLSDDAVGRRVSLNLLLQEHAYLATMASAAVVASRSAEASAAANALTANRAALTPLFGVRFADMWTARTNALLGYASGQQDVRTPLTVDFVRSFASLAGVSQSLVSSQVEATLRVIDDQRAKSSKEVANDDRAAAAAMQPIADSL